MSTPSRIGRTALALGLGAAAPVVFAGQLDYTVFGGIQHSDNITRDASQPISQNVFIPGVNFTYFQQGSVLQAQVEGGIEYRNYLGNTFNDQLFTQLSGLLNWTVLPGRLDFSLEDYAAVQPISALEVDRPNNQQQTNVLVLGPTLHFTLGRSLRGQVELRYINSVAQKTKQFDSSREQGALRLTRDLGPTSQLSFNAESQHVDLRNDNVSPDYNRQQVFARHVRKLARLDIETQLGWSWLDFKQGRSLSTPLAAFTVNWRPTSSQSLLLNASRQYSDAALDMVVRPGQNLPSSIAEVGAGPGSRVVTGSSTITSDVYLERRLEAIYTVTTERWIAHISPLYRRFGYPNDPTFDQVGKGGSIGVDYYVRPQLLLSAFANRETLTYRTLDRRDRTLNVGLSLSGNRTPHWGWRLSLTRQQQQSTLASQRFHENQIYLGLIYKR